LFEEEDAGRLKLAVTKGNFFSINIFFDEMGLEGEVLSN
jgi:hypothetical protein